MTYEEQLRDLKIGNAATIFLVSRGDSEGVFLALWTGHCEVENPGPDALSNLSRGVLHGNEEGIQRRGRNEGVCVVGGRRGGLAGGGECAADTSD